jgi:hypothetical protein
MPITNNNTPILHKKEFQLMAEPVTTQAAGHNFTTDQQGLSDDALYLLGTSTQNGALYSFSADTYLITPAIVTVVTGACSYRSPWSKTMTANGGSTTTITVAYSSFPIRATSVGATLEFTSGANLGIRTTISAVVCSADFSTVTIVIPAVTNAVVSGVTFRMNTGRYFCYAGGTPAAGSFKFFDVATFSVSGNLSITNLGQIAIDGAMTGSFLWGETYATGTATSATATTLVNSAKTWTVNQWTNFQVRITAGTGIGQIRVISSNTATTLTVPTWTVTPDATSVYAIEGDEDKIYILGNAAITMYRYSISADTWTLLSPTTARPAVTGAGCSANFIGDTGDTNYSTESNNLNGRYIWSARGGGSAVIDRFDIAGGTSGAGAWLSSGLTFNENIAQGAHYCVQGKYIYIRFYVSNLTPTRFIRLDTTNFTFTALQNLYSGDSGTITGSVGNRMIFKNLNSSKTVQWIYYIPNGLRQLWRGLVY